MYNFRQVEISTSRALRFPVETLVSLYSVIGDFFMILRLLKVFEQVYSMLHWIRLRCRKGGLCLPRMQCDVRIKQGQETSKRSVLRNEVFSDFDRQMNV